MEELYCSLDFPVLKTFFDFSFAPTLMFYAYVPIIFLSLFFAVFIFLKNRSLQARSLLLVALFFSVWVVNEMVQWIAVYARIVHFGWQLSALLQILTVTLVLYFVYTFLYNKHPPFVGYLSMVILLLPIILALPTDFNIAAFNLGDCEGRNGNIWYYIYGLEILITLFAVYLGIRKYVSSKNADEKKQTLYLLIGTTILLGIFVMTNVAGDWTLVYEFNLVGPVGMALFIAFLSYMIVRFKSFNVKVIGTQALVSALIFLIFALLFIRKIETVRIVSIFTLILTFFLGRSLIRGVKKEIEAKERIEILAKDLEQANTAQESLIRFISHEMKGYLTTSAGTFASIVEGDFNPITPVLKSAAESALSRVREGVSAVMEILSNTNAKKGTLKYTMESLDLSKIVSGAIERFTPDATAKGISLGLDITSGGDYTIVGDKEQIGEHVIRNLIDNAVKYTPEGSVKVSLSRNGDRVVFSVKDTGVGLTDNDKKKLFTEGGRGENSLKVNVHSTGFGLAIAKRIVEYHKGTIRAESQGAGKGSTFLVELPVK